jgi:hypothetical protein
MKYLKLFEDWDEGKEEKLQEDPIISLLLSDFNSPSADDMDDFDLCEAIAVYIYNYNENNPYINYLNSLLHDHKFKPGPGFKYNEEEFEEGSMASEFYKHLENTNIYKKILESNKRYNILNFLKNNSEPFYREFSRYIDGGMEELNKTSKMGEMGYGDDVFENSSSLEIIFSNILNKVIEYRNLLHKMNMDEGLYNVDEDDLDTFLQYDPENDDHIKSVEMWVEIESMIGKDENLFDKFMEYQDEVESGDEKYEIISALKYDILDDLEKINIG